jgi:alpha-tubulin suppressor-like RCC1 family protein
VSGEVRSCGKNLCGLICRDEIVNPAFEPNSIALDDVTSISSGDRHACAITKQGAVYCWGTTENGLVEERKDMKFEYDF